MNNKTRGGQQDYVTFEVWAATDATDSPRRDTITIKRKYFYNMPRSKWADHVYKWLGGKTVAEQLADVEHGCRLVDEECE